MIFVYTGIVVKLVVNVAERRVKQFGNDVSFTPLPPFVLRIFENQLKGGSAQPGSFRADLTSVDEKLRSTLLTFQREGVK